MNKSSSISLATLLIVATVVTSADLPGHSLLSGALQNALHTPAFGVFAIALLVFLREVLPRYRQTPIAYYLLSLGISVLAAAAIEIVQGSMQRDAELIDVVRDILGVVSFLGVHYTLDTRVARGVIMARPGARRVVQLISVLVFASAFVSLGLSGAAYVMRNQAYPQICDFSSAWSAQFVKLQEATLVGVSAPAGWSRPGQDRVARLDLGQSEYPGLTIEEPYPDWSSYETFCVDIFSDEPDTLFLGLRIDDVHHDYSNHDRYTVRLVIAPGLNAIRIPLAEVREAPTGRETDMRAIRRIIIYAPLPEHPVTVFIDQLWLE